MANTRKRLKNCIICGGEFLGGYSAKYCEYCRAYSSKRSEPTVREGRPLGMSRKKRKLSSGKSIKEILAELEAYNREHGTHYTYGQYIELIEGR